LVADLRERAKGSEMKKSEVLGAIEEFLASMGRGSTIYSG
jgi:hypothetical protein